MFVSRLGRKIITGRMNRRSVIVRRPGFSPSDAGGTIWPLLKPVKTDSSEKLSRLAIGKALFPHRLRRLTGPVKLGKVG